MITDDYLLEDEEETPKKPEKERKLISLWQSYIWYDEFVELKKGHLLRIDAIKKGKSKMDQGWEEAWIEGILDGPKKKFGKELAAMGPDAGPIWDWIISIRGLKNGVLAAGLLAQIDDIGSFPTIAKLWRFCGYAVFDGKAEPRGSFQSPTDTKSGRHYNGKLKGICWNICESFIFQQTPIYIDIYYAEKDRQRELHPVAICRKCKIECTIKTKKIKGEEVQVFSCPNNAKHVKDFSGEHINSRGKRKMIKAFLKDLWLEWRKAEGLDIGDEWSG